MALFSKVDNGWKLLSIFVKNLILDIIKGSEYASVF